MLHEATMVSMQAILVFIFRRNTTNKGLVPPLTEMRYTPTSDLPSRIEL